jgi:hypothetical protein
MVPRPAGPSRAELSAPRASGDIPEEYRIISFPADCSPRSRGWSLHEARLEVRGQLLSALAGMVPRSRRARDPSRTAPRTRGDGPASSSACVMVLSCSPHPRGWSPPRQRAQGRWHPAPCTRGDGPEDNGQLVFRGICSPHPRGWSLARNGPADRRRLLPAPTGSPRVCQLRGVFLQVRRFRPTWPLERRFISP